MGSDAMILVFFNSLKLAFSLSSFTLIKRLLSASWLSAFRVVSSAYLRLLMASLVAQRIKHLPAMQEAWVRSLGWEDPLEKENGNPLQYSCLENPIDRGAWWATVHGVAKSWT